MQDVEEMAKVLGHIMKDKRVTEQKKSGYFAYKLSQPAPAATPQKVIKGSLERQAMITSKRAFGIAQYILGAQGQQNSGFKMGVRT